MPELPTCECVRGLPPYDRLTAIYQAAAELSGDSSLPDALCVAAVPPFQRFAYIYAAFRELAGDDSLPSMECVEGEPFADQVTDIYRAAAIYAADSSLQNYLCIRGLPIWQQWLEIYKAIYLAVGAPSELVAPACVNIANLDVLSEVFCALTTGCVTPTLLSATILDDAVTLNLSVPVTGFLAGSNGFTLSVAGAPAQFDYVSGEGTATITFFSDVPAAQGEEVLLSYTPGNITNGDCLLEAFTDFSVTNLLDEFVYLRPGGVDTYLRPGGVDTYIRP